MTRNVRLTALAASVAILAAVLFACAPQPTATPTPAAKKEAAPPGAAAPKEAPPTKPAPTPTPRPKTLVMAVPVVATNLDGAQMFALETFEITKNTQEPLMSFKAVRNPDGLLEIDYTQPVPGLAESWEQSADLKTHTFRLRKGVKSPYGSEMKAQDVLWGWQRGFAIKSPNQLFHGPFLGLVAPDYSTKIEDAIKVIDDYTIQFKTLAPSPAFIKDFANVTLMVYDSTEAKKHTTTDDPWALKWLAANPAGYGPYKVTKHAPGSELILEAWEGYYGGKAKIDKVIFREVPSSATRLALLVAGDVDIAERLTFRELEELKGRSGVKVASWKSNLQMMLLYNYDFKPFDNKKLRQAINYAIPYDDINKTVFFGKGRLWKSPIPDILPESVPVSPYKYDPDKAKALLAEAGHATGLKLKLSYSAAEPEEETIATLIKTSLEKIGVGVELEKLPSAIYNERLYTRKLPLFLWTEMPFLYDPAYATFLFYFSGSPINTSAYKNEEVDKLILQGSPEVDPAKRKEIFKRIQELVADDAAWAWINHPGFHVAMRDTVTPGAWHIENFLRLYEWDKQ